MSTIRKKYFHIKGKPVNTTENWNVVDNYILATLDYTKGRGYTWSMRPIGQYTTKTDEGSIIMNRMTVYVLKESKEIYKECLVPCKRQGKVKEKEAEELFEGNVVAAIENRLGYEIDEEGCD